MKNYQQGFCKELGYYGYWFVRYEKESDDRYHKKEMACSCMRNGCGEKCELFDEEVEVIDERDEWMLKDE